MWVTRFKVQGNGEFPWDMLRYDGCYPATTEDAVRLAVDRSDRELYREVRTVELISLGHVKESCPTMTRWASFGWGVVIGSTSCRRT